MELKVSSGISNPLRIHPEAPEVGELYIVRKFLEVFVVNPGIN